MLRNPGNVKGGIVTRIKICGLSREEDIETVNESRPEYIGFVFAPESRRYVTPKKAEKLRRKLASDIQAVGVFVNAPEELILDLAKNRVIDLIQLHGGEDAAYMSRVRKQSGLPVIKAVSMTSPDAVRQIWKWEQTEVDYLLLDSGKGGTGEQFGYEVFCKTGKLAKPFFLAGGLSPGNLADVIHYFESEEALASCNMPFAADVSSGVETDGLKDREKIAAAVAAVRDSN